MKIQEKIITPQYAKYILENKNPRNRKISPKHIRELTNAMKENKWKSDTAQPIKFDTDGNLIDGQHRFISVVKSNTPIRELVATEIDPESIFYIDTGMARSKKHTLQINGVRNSQVIAGIIRRVDAWKNRGRSRLNNHESFLYYEKNKDLLDYCAHEAGSIYKESGRAIFEGDIATTMYLTMRVNPAKSKEFIEKIGLGINIQSRTSAAAKLRSWLIKDKQSISTTSKSIRLKTIIKYWNKWVEGVEVQNLHTTDKYEKIRG